MECKECPATCCKKTAIIVNPIFPIDIDEYQFMVAHTNISLAYNTESGVFALLIESPCSFLLNDQCTRYEQRYENCRQLDPKQCFENIDTDVYKVYNTPCELLIGLTKGDFDGVRQ